MNSFQCSDGVINFNLGLKGYSVSDYTEHFTKDLISCYNQSFSPPVRRPIQENGMSNFDNSQTHKTLRMYFFPLSFRVSEQRCLPQKSAVLIYFT